MKVLVFDFGGTFTKYSVFDVKRRIYEKGTEGSPLQSQEEYVEFVCVKYTELSRRHELAGIAISMPGLIDEKRGFIQTGGSFLTMRNVSIKKLFGERLPVPVAIENDGKCGALAELWAGNLQEVSDGIVLTLGTALAGGIIKERQIHKGSSLTAGEFSYIILGEERDFRSTAFYQCSTSCLLLRAYLKKHVDVRINPNYAVLSQIFNIEQDLTEEDHTADYSQGIDGKKFFDMLATGDQDIQELYQEYTYNLAKLVLNLQTIYAPEKILIGGGVSKQERLIGDIYQQCERQQQYYQGLIDIKVDLGQCRLGSEANQYGALYNFLKQYKIL
ncbi:ROK family protein [Lachnospiraceae bacterium OttesenSCG-928-E19]|nr:ROK family protein [Lachnospiraceae bacterium OttesenSCG-928-E19]